jgi:DNA polymerase-3 subunit chi
MPDITFYFNVQRRETALCQLVGKALQHQHTLNILTDSEAASDSLDRLLWEIPSTGFLPHCSADHALAEQTPICIDHRSALFQARDILFNWSTQLPPQLDHYQRIIEIVDNTQPLRHDARQRFRAYQAQGYSIKTIDMAALTVSAP